MKHTPKKRKPLKKSPGLIRVNVYFKNKQEVERLDKAAQIARRSRSEFIAVEALRAASSVGEKEANE